MTHLHRLVLAGALALGVSSTANAAILDFTAFPAGLQGTNVLNLPEATVTGFNDDLFVGAGGMANSICSLDFGCNGNMEIAWDFDVQDVEFDFGIANPGDQATITGFDSLGVQIGQIVLNLESGTGHASLAAFGTFRSVTFDNTLATGGGYAYGNINYDHGGVVIPLPATLALLLSGLAGIGLIGRRRAAV